MRNKAISEYIEELKTSKKKRNMYSKLVRSKDKEEAVKHFDNWVASSGIKTIPIVLDIKKVKGGFDVEFIKAKRKRGMSGVGFVVVKGDTAKKLKEVL